MVKYRRNQRRVLNLTGKAKIALILGVLLVIAIILVFYFNRKAKEQAVAPDETTTSGDIFAPDLTKTAGEAISETALSPEAVSSDQINYVSPAPGASATKVTARTPVSTLDKNGIRTYEITVTPAPNAGPYDWTRTFDRMTVKDASGSPYANKTLCSLANLSDSWSNLFEKVTCDSLNFFDQKIFEPLLNLTCAFTASALQVNVRSGISYEFRDGACLIIDRQ